MSLLPLLLDIDPWEVRRPRHNDWDLFGLGISPREIQELVCLPTRWPNTTRKQVCTDLAPATIGKDGFQVCCDVQQFRPSEISVKTVDNTVVIEGKHEERPDEHGCISRHFIRKYTLPKGYDSKDVVSTLSSDGVLTIKAPPLAKQLENKERVVQIQQTGPAHLNVKENAAGGEQEQPKGKK